MHGLFSKFILNWQFVSAFILCLLCFSLQADSAAWTGGADDGLWTTDGNWFPENSPGAGDTATFAEAGDITQADNIIVENLNVTAGSHTFEPLIFGANNIGTATISSSGITIFGDEFLDSGTINHTGTGTTTFNGDNQVSDVNLNNGTISLGGGSLDFVDFIFGGGTLNGSGVLEGSVNVASGTISPSGNAAIGSFQTNGNFTLGASGVYELNISPVESDQIIVDGDISLVDGNTVNIIPLNGTYTIGSTYNIMTATGDITGEITNLTESHPKLLNICCGG